MRKLIIACAVFAVSVTITPALRTQFIPYQPVAPQYVAPQYMAPQYMAPQGTGAQYGAPHYVAQPLASGQFIAPQAAVPQPVAGQVIAGYAPADPAGPRYYAYSPGVATAVAPPAALMSPSVVAPPQAVLPPYYAAPTFAYRPQYYAAPPVTAYRPVVAGYAAAPVVIPGAVAVGRPVIVRPKYYVPGQPIRNVLRAITP